MPTNADLLLDTSAAIALVQSSNDRHGDVLRSTRGKRLGLAGHALIETFSVLTRLPGAQRVSAATAVRIIRTDFPAGHALSAPAGLAAIDVLARAGITGGAVYDGLVGLAAKEAGIRLLSCDRRAMSTYDRLDVDIVLI